MTYDVTSCADDVNKYIARCTTTVACQIYIYIYKYIYIYIYIHLPRILTIRVFPFDPTICQHRLCFDVFEQDLPPTLCKHSVSLLCVHIDISRHDPESQVVLHNAQGNFQEQWSDSESKCPRETLPCYRTERIHMRRVDEEEGTCIKSMLGVPLLLRL